MKKILFLCLSSLLLISSCSNTKTSNTESSQTTDEIDSSLDEYSDEPFFFEKLTDTTCRVTGNSENQLGKDIEEITIPSYSPDGLKVVAIGYFNERKRLKKITIPNTVTSILGCTFSKNSSLTEVTFEKGNMLETIPNNVFEYCCCIENIQLPNHIKTIEKEAFYNCTGLKSINLPESIEKIEEKAFFGCQSLTNIEIPKNLKYLDNISFYSCDALTSVIIPSTIHTIKDFTNCDKLENVTIQDGVREILKFCFSNDNALKKIFIPKSVGVIEKYAFAECSKDLTIYCAATSQPASWDDDWNSSNYKVVWSATREDVQ